VKSFIEIVKVIHMIGIEPIVMVFPKFSTPKPKIIRGKIRLVVKHAVLPSICLDGVVYVQTTVIGRQRIHELAKNVEIADHTRIIFVQGLSVFQNRFSQNENTVDVCSDSRVDIHRILQRENVEHIPVPSALVHPLLYFRVEYFGAICAIVTQDNCPRIVHFLLR
jgi:hypothetical protein